MLKKIVKIILLNLLIIFLISQFNFTTTFASTNRSYFYININLNDNYEDKLFANIYISDKICDDNGDLLYYSHTYHSTILLNNTNIIERPSDYFLIEIEIENNEYGTENKRLFITPTSNYVDINIYKINIIEPYIESNNYLAIKIMSSSGINLDVKYSIKDIIFQYSIDEVEQYNQFIYTIKMDINNKNYVVDRELILDLPFKDKLDFLIKNKFLDNLNFSNEDCWENDAIYEQYHSTNSTSESSNINACVYDENFVVYFDDTITTTEDANRTINYLNEIKTFFCDDSTFGLNRANNLPFYQTTIYIVDNDTIGGAHGRVKSINGLYYIQMNNLILQEFSNDNWGYYKSVLAHEYFHLILYSYNIKNKWFHESMATWAQMYFCRQKEIETTYINRSFNVHLSDFYLRFLLNQQPLLELSEASQDNGYYYGSFLFFENLIMLYSVNIVKELCLEYNVVQNLYSAFNNVLQKYNSSFKDLFISFCINNIYLETNYQDIYDYSKYILFNYHTLNEYNNLDNNKSHINSCMLKGNSVKNFYMVDKICNHYSSYVTLSFNSISDIVIFKTILNDNGISNYQIDLNSNIITIPQHMLGSLAAQEVTYSVINYNYFSSGINVDWNITFEHPYQDVEENNANEVGSHIHSYKKFESPYNLVAFKPNKSALYEIETELIRSNGISNGVKITVLNQNMEVLQKCEHEGYNDLAVNTDHLFVYLEEQNLYYIKIEYQYAFNNITLYINKLKSQYYLSNDDNIYIEQQILKDDKFIAIDIERCGKYDIEIEYVGLNNTTLLANFSSYYLKETDNFRKHYSTVITSNNYLYQGNLQFPHNSRLYIGYFGGNNEGLIKIKICRKINNSILLNTDLNSNVSIGTEVSLNNGSYQGKTITQGFTRVLYVQRAMELSRLRYFWYSTNPNVALVSKYGTITAISPGTTTIIGVYYFDYSIVGKLEITVLEDTTTEIKNVILTTDNREDPNLNGTEVKNGMGSPGEFSIHKGYTRVIGFKSGNPTTSIQDFTWTSSNPDVATVSIYGTVTALKEGVTTITGIYKYNSNYIATSTFVII